MARRRPGRARLQLALLTALAATLACAEVPPVDSLRLVLPQSADPGAPQEGPALPTGQVHSWQLDAAVSKCRGAVVAELWEDVAAAQAAAPYMPQTFLCPVVATQRYEALQADPKGIGRYRNWFKNAHNSTQAYKVQAATGKLLHWDRGGCSRQLPYHRIVLNAAPATVKAHTWWLLVVNTRNDAVPFYQVRLTCAQRVPQHCPQPDPTGKPCSGAGVCKIAEFGYQSAVDEDTFSDYVPSQYDPEVKVPQCVCDKGRTGIGCESVLKQVLPGDQWIQLQPTYDPHMKLVANSTLNTPWSMVQFQLAKEAAKSPPGDSWQLTIELETDWSGVVDVNEAFNLPRPRLCFGGEKAAIDNRVDPMYLTCHKPLSFPNAPRAALNVFLFDLQSWPYSRVAYAVAMDLGAAPTRLRLRVAPAESGRNCAFDCSGQPGACTDFGYCSKCKANADYDWCDFVDDYGSPSKLSIFPGQKVWVSLRGYSNTSARALHSRQWARVAVRGPANALAWQGEQGIYATGYWVRGSAGCWQSDRPGLASSSYRTPLLAITNFTEGDGPRPEVLCITPERPLAKFQPTCKPSSTKGGRLCLLVMLRGGNNLGDASVALQISRKDLRFKKKLPPAAIAGISIAAAVALAALVLGAWYSRRWPGWSRWRPGTRNPTGGAQANPTGGAGTAAASPPVAPRNKQGLPPSVLEMLPTRVYSGHRGLQREEQQQPPPQPQPQQLQAADPRVRFAAEDEDQRQQPSAADHKATSAAANAGGAAAVPDVAIEAGALSQQGSSRGGAQAAPKAAAAARPSGVALAPQASLDNMCTICLAEYLKGDVLRHLPCLHTFHRGCVDAWLVANHTCPTCRLDLLHMMGDDDDVQPRP